MVVSIWLALRELLLQTLWGKEQEYAIIIPESVRICANLNDITAKHTPLKHPLETEVLPDFEPTCRDGQVPPHNH